MKKVLLIALVVVGAVSYGRDFDRNERRDIVAVGYEQAEKMNRLTEAEWNLEGSIWEENFKNYRDFHKELETMDKGHENK